MKPQVNLSFLLQHPNRWLAFGLGSGLSPIAPGTMGTIAAIPLAYYLMMLPLWAIILIIVLTTLWGIHLCGVTARDLHTHDHPGIVWDEWVGYFIAVIPLSNHWQGLLLAFVLFRFFDIVKPWPIRLIDHQVKGGFGIMLDDILAGIAAALVGAYLWHFTSWFPFAVTW